MKKNLINLTYNKCIFITVGKISYLLTQPDRKASHFRLALAAMHFNENTGRTQAVTKAGELQWRISFPKSRRGEAVAKEVKTDQTYGMYKFITEYIRVSVTLLSTMLEYMYMCIYNYHIKNLLPASNHCK